MSTSRLGLGTVQLGLNYGIANKNGKPDFESAFEIVKYAVENGIQYFDTAQAYGDSEIVLGRIFQKLNFPPSINIVSKFNPNLDYMQDGVLEKSVKRTITNLQGIMPWAFLLHNAEWLKFWEQGLCNIIRDLIRKSEILKFGVSVYTVDEALTALSIDEISVIQLPFNIFSKDFIMEDIFRKCKEKRVNVFVRSIYLQGLLLIDPDKTPEHMMFAQKYLIEIEKFCLMNNLDKKDFCLFYSIFKSMESIVLIGIENKIQIQDNIDRLGKNKYSIELIDEWDRILSCLDLDARLVNPSLWPKKKE